MPNLQLSNLDEISNKADTELFTVRQTVKPRILMSELSNVIRQVAGGVEADF